MGFRGLVVTDAVIMAAATASEAEAPATVAAVAAGCDALLYPEDFASVVKALDRAVGGVIPTARADEALARCDQAAAAWDRGPDQRPPALPGHRAFADEPAGRVCHLV